MKQGLDTCEPLPIKHFRNMLCLYEICGLACVWHTTRKSRVSQQCNWISGNNWFVWIVSRSRNCLCLLMSWNITNAFGRIKIKRPTVFAFIHSDVLLWHIKASSFAFRFSRNLQKLFILIYPKLVEKADCGVFTASLVFCNQAVNTKKASKSQFMID